MALAEGKIAIRFAGGVETGEDDKHVVLDKLLACENAVSPRVGLLGKRNGSTTLPRTRLDADTPLPDARATAKRDAELLAFDDGAGYSYVAAAGGWRKAGDIVCPTLSLQPVADSPREQTYADRAAVDGVVLLTWAEADGVYLSLLDETTGRVLLARTQYLADGIKPRATVSGSVLLALAVDATNDRLYLATMSAAAPTTAPVISILTDGLDATFNDYDVHAGVERTLVAWYSSAGDIRTGYIHPSGVLGSPVTGLPSVTNHAATVAGPLACASDDNSDRGGCVVYFDGTAVKRLVLGVDLDPLGTATVEASAPSCARLSVCHDTRDGDAGIPTAWVAWDELDSSTRIVRIVSISEVDVLGTPVTVRASKVAGRPFLEGTGGDTDRIYVPLAYESTRYTTLFVVRDDGLLIARALSGLYSGAPALNVVPNSVVTDRVLTTTAIYRRRLEADDQFAERGIQVVSLDFGAADSHQSALVGRTAYLAGAGFVWQYDGEGFTEQGFHYAPEVTVAPTQDVPVGDGVEDGTHTYGFAYGWKNAQGEVEWGPVHLLEVVVAGGPRQVEFSAIPTLRHTAKTAPRAECFIGVFRDEANDGETLSLVSSLDPTATGANGYLANDPTVDAVAFTDELADADIPTREPLYTNGGVLSNEPTPTAGIIASAKDRLFANDPSDPSALRFGQVRRDGYVAELSPFLETRLDSFGGPVTAAIEQDGAMIAFRRRAVYRFGGAGPTPSNAGGFGDPQLIHTDVGAIDARVLCATPVGTVFLSEKGFRLLDRSLQAHYIGRPVEKYTDATRSPQTFVSAELLPDRNEVRFLSASGISLHYNYDRNIWSEWPNYLGVAAEIVDGSYYYVRDDGNVYVETPGVYRDVNRHVPFAVETAWPKFGGYLQGWQRIWHASVIGRQLSTCQLRFRAAFDYRETWEVDITVDPADWFTDAPYGGGDYGEGVYGGASDSLFQIEFHLDRECQAAKFRIEDVEETGVYGAAFELSEILITGGLQATKAVLRAERQA